MEERRRFKRVPAQHIIWYDIKDYNKMQNYDDDVDIGIPMESVDISLGGAKIIHNKPIPKDAYLKTIISLPTHQEPIIIVAKVVWTQQITDSKFAVGLEFENFLNEKQKILEDYINTFAEAE